MTQSISEPLPLRPVRLYALVLIPWLVLLLLASYVVVLVELRSMEQNFRQEIGDQLQHISHRVHVTESVAEGFAAVVGMSDQLDRQRTSTYLRRVLNRYPHILMGEAAVRVAAADLPLLINEMQVAGYTEFKVRGFGFDSDREWTTVSPAQFHTPIIYLEPMPAESRKILGLDIESNALLRNSLAQSERVGKPLATHPFNLVEGPRAYLVHRLVPKSNQSGHMGQQRYILLVVLADQLLPQADMREGRSMLLYHADFDRADPAGHLLHQKPGQQDSLQTRLFPRFEYEMKLNSETQPMVLRSEWQLGFADINRNLLLTVGLAALFTLFVCLAFARIYAINEQQRFLAEKRLYQLARFDALTGLSNRQSFLDSLQQALARARRQNTQLAVLFMDLNGFKAINDRLGHAAGDHLLKLVAGRLGASLREVDRLARYGGDEFVILIEHVTEKHEVKIVEEKLIEAMAKPFQLDEQRVEVGLSIGIAMFPGDGTTNEQLLGVADSAMYSKKRARQAEKPGSESKPNMHPIEPGIIPQPTTGPAIFV
jgi:diguanylate cyclase (GGDEF)-like protein